METHDVMAELTFFKFIPSHWDNGNIQLCSLSSKGLFADICATYWVRQGELPYAYVLQKHCKGDATLLQELIDNEVVVVSEKNIIIQFLDEQLTEFIEISEKRRTAANKRWDAKAMQEQSTSNAIREDKIREEKKEGKLSEVEKREILRKRSSDLISELKEIQEEGEYPAAMLDSFYGYWTEPNKSLTKMRYELERTWDTRRRLATWASRDRSFSQGRTQQGKSGRIYIEKR